MKRIFIIDDDIHIGNMLEEVLRKEGYEVLRAYSGTEALLALSSSRPDLILLDLMLPGLSGEEILPQIREFPVIVLSAKADIDSKVNLLLGGAADYVTKPFAIKELLARISAALRKSTPPAGDVLSFENLRLDTLTHILSGDRVPENTAREIRLTRTEYAILKTLMRNPSRIIPKSLLLDRISEDTPDCTEHSLKTHISNLRKKLRDVGGREYIEAVWGIGFRLIPEKS